jgi:hypothetical protein
METNYVDKEYEEKLEHKEATLKIPKKTRAEEHKTRNNSDSELDDEDVGHTYHT